MSSKKDGVEEGLEIMISLKSLLATVTSSLTLRCKLGRAELADLDLCREVPCPFVGIPNSKRDEGCGLDEFSVVRTLPLSMAFLK